MNAEPRIDEWRGKLFRILAPPISILHIYFNTLGTVSGLWQNSIHFASFLILAGLVYPYKGKGSNLGFVRVIDFVFVLVASFAALFLIYQENAIYDRGVTLTLLEQGMVLMVIVGAIEYTRRITGWVIPILIVLSLLYVTGLGRLIEGVFHFSGLSTETILFRSIFSDEAIFGNIAEISSTFVFMFVLFGAFLIRSGAGDFIIGLAQVMSGKLTGGPGFVALFSSALTGTISGSAVANAASTGVITIPLMKKSGFNSRFAAGIEAAASTGGQIMPPIMGAGAFVMSSFTQIPYTQIVLYSVLPAVIYFATIGFYIRFEAKKLNLKPDPNNQQNFMKLFKEGGWALILPLVLLIIMLVIGYTPTYAAGFAIIAIIVSSWFSKTKMGIVAVIDSLEMGAKNMILTAVVLCSVGLVVNTIAMTGIGNTFSLMISIWSQGNLLLALLLIALASLILGMGLPVTASYIILGTLSAPVMYQLILNRELILFIAENGVPETLTPIIALLAPDKMEALKSNGMSLSQIAELVGMIPPDILLPLYEQMFSASHLMLVLLSSHLIIFWLSQDSNVTPPVCLVAFTTAAIAKTPPMKTGFEAWKISKGLYLVPYLIAFTPLISGSFTDQLKVALFALAGAYAISASFQGYMEKQLSIVQRIFLLAVGIICIYPDQVYLNLAGLLTIFGFMVMQKIGSKKS